MTNLLDDTDSRHGSDETDRSTPVLSVTKHALRVAAERWVDYPEATRIFQRLEDLCTQSRGPDRRNLLIVGPDNNGKSALARRFAALHPPQIVEAGGVSVPVVVLSAPPVLNRVRFIHGMHDALFMPYQAHGVGQLKFADELGVRKFGLLEYIGLRLLVIDDLHHMLLADETEQKLFLEVVREFTFQGIAIAATAPEERAAALLGVSGARALFEVARLPRWRMGPDYLGFLADMERYLPPDEPLGLAKSAHAKAILKASRGAIGGIIDAVVARTAEPR